MQRRDAVTDALRQAAARGVPALVGFLTAGFPDRESFAGHLTAIAEVADIVEIGVPFSDPMADGVTIQRSSRVALEQGTTLAWIFEMLAALPARPRAPLVLMSYLNPLLAFGIRRLPGAAHAAGISGMVVPDLPWEECGELRGALARKGLALVQMVTPLTPAARLAKLVCESQGFVYAVTATGTTGREVAIPNEVLSYLDRVRAAASLPVCAGFGIRNAAQVRRLAGHVDGVIVGSALVDLIDAGGDPAAFLAGLRA
jgi:tryptophan synthase alpha chain